jgi:hypothetical protein
VYFDSIGLELLSDPRHVEVHKRCGVDPCLRCATSSCGSYSSDVVVDVAAVALALAVAATWGDLNSIFYETGVKLVHEICIHCSII